jgi:hypothetical protein
MSEDEGTPHVFSLKYGFHGNRAGTKPLQHLFDFLEDLADPLRERSFGRGPNHTALEKGQPAVGGS